MPLDNGGIPDGALPHEQPGYYREKYFDLLRKLNKALAVIKTTAGYDTSFCNWKEAARVYEEITGEKA